MPFVNFEEYVLPTGVISMWPNTSETQDIARRRRQGGVAGGQRASRPASRGAAEYGQGADGSEAGSPGRCQRRRPGRAPRSQPKASTTTYRDPKLPFGLWLRQMAQDRIIDLHRPGTASPAAASLDREQQAGPALGDRSSLELAAQLRDPELTPARATLRKELLTSGLSIAIDGLEDEDPRDPADAGTSSSSATAKLPDLLGLSQPAAGMRHPAGLAAALREVLV